MMKYKKMNVRELRVKLAERGLLETGLKTKEQCLRRLLEDDKRLLTEEASRAASKKQLHKGILSPGFTVVRTYTLADVYHQ